MVFRQENERFKKCENERIPKDRIKQRKGGKPLFEETQKRKLRREDEYEKKTCEYDENL